METDKGQNCENCSIKMRSRKLEDRGKRALFLLGCFFLAGCGKEMEEEEQQAEISVESSIQSEIMSGDFSRLDEDDGFKEQIESAFHRWESGETHEIEWRIIDLNGDGIEDLIVQNKETVGESEMKQIFGIFACGEESARCVEWDLNDMTEYSFCGPTGELIYTAYNYGFIPDEEPYWHYYYDKDWNKINDYLLVIYWIDSTVDPEYAEIWREEHPDLAEDGIYYRKYTEDGMEELTRGEWEEMYETVTGYEVDSELIRREERRQEKAGMEISKISENWNGNIPINCKKAIKLLTPALRNSLY